MAIGNVNEFMGISKGEVPMLEHKFLCSCLILCDMCMANTGGEF